MWKKKDISIPKLSTTEVLILQLLLESSKEMYGLQMIEASKSKLKKGTIYVTLQRMEEKGFIESRPETRPKPEIGIARRMYKITGQGSQIYKAYEAFIAKLQEAHIN